MDEDASSWYREIPGSSPGGGTYSFLHKTFKVQINFFNCGDIMSNLKLYSLATPNGRKVSILLEELGLEYEAIKVDIMKGEQHEEWFSKLNPNQKIPVLVDGDTIITESGAIMWYLAEKHKQFIPEDLSKKTQVSEWLFFQMASVGPMFGQFGHFTKFAKEDIPYAKKRYEDETKRILGVLEKRLENREYLVDEYSIADMATFPWVGCLDWGYARADLLEEFPNVKAWHDRCANRPAAKKGAQICKL